MEPPASPREPNGVSQPAAAQLRRDRRWAPCSPSTGRLRVGRLEPEWCASQESLPPMRNRSSCVARRREWLAGRSPFAPRAISTGGRRRARESLRLRNSPERRVDRCGGRIVRQNFARPRHPVRCAELAQPRRCPRARTTSDWPSARKTSPRRPATLPSVGGARWLAPASRRKVRRPCHRARRPSRNDAPVSRSRGVARHWASDELVGPRLDVDLRSDETSNRWRAHDDERRHQDGSMRLEPEST